MAVVALYKLTLFKIKKNYGIWDIRIVYIWGAVAVFSLISVGYSLEPFLTFEYSLMIHLIRFTLLLSFSLLSCTNKKSSKQLSQSDDRAKPVAYWSNDSIGNSLIDTAYMLTGFYLLADERGQGVKMRMEHSNEIYAINPKPFASVKNLREVKVERNNLDNQVYTELCIAMNEQGTQDLKEGMKRSLNKDIAIVIANRLLYVVRNKMSTTSNGKMCIGMNDYAEDEVEAMRNAVEQKR